LLDALERLEGEFEGYEGERPLFLE